MNEKEIQRYLELIILQIHEKIQSSNLDKDAQAMKLIEEIHRLLDQYGELMEEVMPESILTSYFAGVEEASSALVAAGVTAGSLPINRTLHLEAIAGVLDDTMLDLQSAIRTAKMNSAGNITDTLTAVQNDIAQGLIAGDPRKAITARVARSFEAGGLTAFVTSDGKKLPLDFYAMTVTRTKTRQATVEGSSRRYTEAGQDLVQITENSDTCPVCAKYNRLVVSLTGDTPGYPVAGRDIPLPPYHPNCRGTTRPFVLSGKTERELREARERNAQFDPEKDVRTPAQKRAYEREQEKRRKANAEKKQYARWKTVLGDKAPKTLGAFRRMKRNNSSGFQKLSADYRRILRESNP